MRYVLESVNMFGEVEFKGEFKHFDSLMNMIKAIDNLEKEDGYELVMYCIPEEKEGELYDEDR